MSTQNHFAHTGFTILAWIFAVCVVIQVFLAGLGVFVDEQNFKLHTTFVMFFQWLPLIMLILALIGRMPTRMWALSLGMLVFIVLQYITAILSDSLGMLSAVHPVIALVLFGMSLYTARISRLQGTANQTLNHTIGGE